MPTASPIVAWLIASRYAFLYPLAIVEGPILMMICGFLIRTGFLAFWPAYLLLVAGDLTGDVAWYLVGRHGARWLIEKYGKFFSVTEENFKKAEEKFKEHQTKILFISKLTTGFGFAVAVLMAAGAARVPFKKYITINFFGEFIWAGVLVGVGFFFGNVYTTVDKGLHWVFVIGIVVLFAALMYGFGKAMKGSLGKKFFS